MNTYLFYDIETTGLNVVFDQVLQFAAVRTDMNFNEIDSYNMVVKLRPDVIPSPGAMMTNQISIQDSMSGLCEFEAISKIHELMNAPGTISLGYNTMGFDDEFLRFSFYRNLLAPYTHQYKDRCHRMDLLPITVIYYLYKPDLLNWPEYKGKNSLKLEQLNKANSLATGNAHDAQVDVNAVVELAKKFSKENDTWNYLCAGFNKTTDSQRIENLPVVFTSSQGDHSQALMTGSRFGTDLGFQIPVLGIGKSIPYSNQTLWLRLDLAELSDTTEDSIIQTTEVIRKKIGEPEIILPPHKRYWKHLGSDRSNIVEKNIEWLKSNTGIFHKIIEYYRNFRYPVIPDLDIDAALYDIGFLSRKEDLLCRQFHNADFNKKIELIKQFERTELHDLAVRVVCRNYPEKAPSIFTEYYKSYMQRVNPLNSEQRLLDYRGTPRITPIDVIKEIDELKKSNELNSYKLKLLTDLADYIKSEFE